MFRPNQIALHMRMLPTRTIFGKESFANPVQLPCAVVHVIDRIEESSVRADSSASRGSAEQQVLQAKFLVPPHTVIKAGDVVKIQGRNIEVSAIEPRWDTRGNLDHLEIGGNLKGDL